MEFKNNIARLIGELATGGSAPYSYQFQKSVDKGRTWLSIGSPIKSMQTTLQPLEISDANTDSGTLYRLNATDGAEPKASVCTAPVGIE